MASWKAPEELKINQSVNSINPLNWIIVGNRIRKQKPELVIFKYWLPFMGPCFGTIARQIKKNRVSKIITIVDNIIPHEKRPGDELMTRYFVKPIDGFIAMSKSVLDDISFFDNKSPRKLCPHPLFDNFGAPLSRKEALQQLDLDPNFRYLLFFGFIRDYKGLDWLLKAFADKRLEKFPVKLIVAGEYYTDGEKYEQIIAQNQLSERVIMHTDFIADNEVRRYFCAADMIVQPYKTATQSGVTQIGYHFGKPMLVTNVGGLSEIIPNQKVGYVVEPNVDAIADALVDFYSHSRESEMVKNTKEEKKKYAWKRMVDAVIEVYKKI